MTPTHHDTLLTQRREDELVLRGVLLGMAISMFLACAATLLYLAVR